MSATTSPSMLSRLRLHHEFNLLAAVVAVVIAVAVFDSQHNYWVNPGSSAKDLVRQTSMLGIYALGAAIVIIAGGIDLSTGSVMAFGGTVCGSVLLLLVPEQMLATTPLPLWAVATAIAATLFSGFLIGSLHAWLITVVGLPPFIATLGTLVGLRSLSRALCEAVTLSTIGGRSTQINLFDGNFLYLARSVWIPAVLVLVLAALLTIFLSCTIPGRHLYALGGNEQAARLSGIRTDRLKWLAYVISAMLSSLAGIIAVCDQGVITPLVVGRGAELLAIAAAVVGGCSLQGGVGTIPGTLLGALFLRAVVDGVAKIIKTGADVYEGLIVGVVVVGAVTFTRGNQAGTARRSYFAGALGVVTILNLALLAAAFMALIGADYLGSKVQLETGWLASWAAVFVLGLLLIWRGPASRGRNLAVAGWCVALIVGLIALDRAYPGIQRGRAVASISRLGGRVAQGADGSLEVDLKGTRCGDADLARLTRQPKSFPSISLLQLEGTSITDRGTTALRDVPQVRRIDVSHTGITRSGTGRVQRLLPGTTVVNEASANSNAGAEK